jgi:hypothetical protein
VRPWLQSPVPRKKPKEVLDYLINTCSGEKRKVIALNIFIFKFIKQNLKGKLRAIFVKNVDGIHILNIKHVSIKHCLQSTVDITASKNDDT